MEETTNPMERAPKQDAPALGKFKDVDALLHAYEALEAEFTRRSQRLKALEEERERAASVEQADHGEDLLRAAKESEQVRSAIVQDYLDSLRGVPLMAGGGTGVTAPPVRPKNLSEAGSLALGYFKNNRK